MKSNIERLKELSGKSGLLKVIHSNLDDTSDLSLYETVIRFNNHLDLEFKVDNVVGRAFLLFREIS